MKRNVFALIFSLLFVLSCSLASCNANQKIFDENSSEQDSSDTVKKDDYETAIKELENQILALQQSQSKNDEKNQQELQRLQNLLEQLKNEQQKPSDSDNQQNNSSNQDNKDENQKPSTDQKPSQPDSDDTEDSSSETNKPQSDQKPSESSAKFLYTTDGNSATITGYTGEGKTLVIPSMIDGYYVLEIADNAFENTKFEKVIVSAGITKIGWFAFRNCPFLSSVTLPATVEQIGYSAFSGASENLTFYVSVGSFALRYAQSYGFSYVTV